MLTNALLKDLSEVRTWLARTNPWIVMKFTQIEDELFAMECEILTLEEENQRLKSIIHGQLDPAEGGYAPIGQA
jgi:hypothetical protein